MPDEIRPRVSFIFTVLPMIAVHSRHLQARSVSKIPPHVSEEIQHAFLNPLEENSPAGWFMADLQ
jgi:hypothetical protein